MHNTISVDSGRVTLNGNRIPCITDLKIESIPSEVGMMHVQMGFDAYMKDVSADQNTEATQKEEKHMGPSERRKLRICAVTNGTLVDMGELPDKLPDLTPKEPVYKRIRISFLHAGSIVIDENDWDDYEIYDGFLVIKKGEAWIAMYNMEEIFSVVLEK